MVNLSFAEIAELDEYIRTNKHFRHVATLRYNECADSLLKDFRITSKELGAKEGNQPTNRVALRCKCTQVSIRSSNQDH